MRHIYKIFMSAVSAALMLATLVCISSCGDSSVEGTDTVASSQTAELSRLDYGSINIQEYVGSVKYTGFDVVLEASDTSREDALWELILDSAQILAYPENEVEYYFGQTKASYMYLVNGNEDDYRLLLESRGTDETKMREDAKKLVKKDLVYYYIVTAEGINVTDAEKQTLFERYVEEYVSAYGYRREYVIESMTDNIYESMLYDKTMEFLLMNNSFTADQVNCEVTK